MESIIKADVFFFISSIATVIITLLLSVLLFYVKKKKKNLYELSEKIKIGFEDSEEFVSELRERLENNIVFRIFFPPTTKKRITRTKKDD